MSVSTISSPRAFDSNPRTLAHSSGRARAGDEAATRRAASRLVASFQPHLEGQSSFVVHLVGVRAGAGVTHVAGTLADAAADQLDGRILLLDAAPFARTAQSRENRSPASGALARRIVPYERQSLACAPVLPDLRAHYADLRERYRLVVVDCPPVADHPASSILSTLADQTILVVRAEHSRVGEVALSARLLRQAGVIRLATVLNGERRRLPDWIDRLL